MWEPPFVAYQTRHGEGGLEVASTEGIVGLSVAMGRRLSALNESAVEFAKSLKPKSLQFRTDGDKVIAKDAKALMETVGDIPKGLTQ
jgi:hypothetical protein